MYLRTKHSSFKFTTYLKNWHYLTIFLIIVIFCKKVSLSKEVSGLNAIYIIDHLLSQFQHNLWTCVVSLKMELPFFLFRFITTGSNSFSYWYYFVDLFRCLQFVSYSIYLRLEGKSSKKNDLKDNNSYKLGVIGFHFFYILYYCL